MTDQNNNGKKPGGVFKLITTFMAVAGIGVVSYMNFVPHSNSKDTVDVVVTKGPNNGTKIKSFP